MTKDNYYCTLKSLYLKFLCQINSLSIEVLEKFGHLPLLMITWEEKPKDQKLPSGHLLKDIIRSSELDLILPSQTLYPLHIRLWPLQWSSSLCLFIYLNRRKASSTGMKGKPKSHLSLSGTDILPPCDLPHISPQTWPEGKTHCDISTHPSCLASPTPPHQGPSEKLPREGLVNIKIKRSCMGTKAGSWFLCPFHISFVSIWERIYSLSSR